MPETAAIVIGLSAGVLLSGIYFFALWFTVHRIGTADKPYILAGVSFILRMGTVMGVMAVIGKYIGPVSLIAAAVSFLAARLVIMGVLKKDRRAPA
jgi:F1F0 ATPase subunit 2